MVQVQTVARSPVFLSLFVGAFVVLFLLVSNAAAQALLFGAVLLARWIRIEHLRTNEPGKNLSAEYVRFGVSIVILGAVLVFLFAYANDGLLNVL